VQRWLRWLDDRGAIDRRPMVAVVASIICALTARPVEAERWAEAVDRWEYGNLNRPDDPLAEAWAAVLRALLCRRGVDQMRADADEAVRRSATDRSMAPPALLFQGIARVLSGDLDGGDTAFQDAVSAGEEVGAPEGVVTALCERSFLAMDRSDWSQAETLAEQASTVARGAGYEDALLSAVQARAALRRGDVPTVRRVLVDAQRLRPLLTYALPHVAVQARSELARVHLGLADLAGARTLMREVDEVLRRRPGLGTLVEEAQALRAQLAEQRGTTSPGASALTAAELRLLPLLSTHLSFPEIGQELFVSRHTVKSQVNSIYRKLDASSRSQAVTRARQLGLLEG